MEELISVGEEVQACPYYGSRYAVPKAEVSDNFNFTLLILFRYFIVYPEIAICYIFCCMNVCHNSFNSVIYIEIA